MKLLKDPLRDPRKRSEKSQITEKLLDRACYNDHLPALEQGSCNIE